MRLAASLIALSLAGTSWAQVRTKDVEATPLEEPPAQELQMPDGMQVPNAEPTEPLFPNQSFPELSEPTIRRARNIDGQRVVLRALDKVTAQTEDFTVDVGDTLTFGSLDVAVRHCEVRPPEEIPETFAFLQIDDRRYADTGEEGEPERVFSGWMLGSNPAKAALDHAVYDVWVIRCLTQTS